jgi:hypothetical protein
VQLLGHPLHTLRKLVFVDNDIAIRATAVGPAVVKNDIVVAYVPEAGVEEYAGRIEEKGLGDVAAKRVPIVPAHLRGSGQTIVDS